MLATGGFLSALGIVITVITALSIDPAAYPNESLALFSVGGLFTLALPATMALGAWQFVRGLLSP